MNPTTSEASWAGRVALITGATKGIGRACALRFGRNGAEVVVHGRDALAAARVVEEISVAGGRARAILGDLRDAEFCKRLIDSAGESAGRIDALINNAGANVFKGTLEATLDDWNDCLDLDLRAAWLCSKEAVAHMRPGSAIVNVSSNHAGSTLPGVFPYNVAKAGLNALTQSLAIELADRGIRVNTVAPGYIDTPINDAYFATFPDPEGARADAERLHPIGRLGTADEVAAAIEFLADDQSSGFTTGTTLTIDGGRAALLQDPRSTEATA
ncbi:SDR family NAD(P)-dependent oxidoreductase [Diaminobutyricibacter sp. McL0608]|uniref:SDR family NAD(P)-dependent oxidoreductase n=1 Tax=Leifsonia sp. McL0608 TaxID=3143537 RepID=UPI0031F30515